jgi:hypothetical protein
VRRELENLEDFGLLAAESAADNPETAEEKSANRQDKKYFRVNKDFPLFENVKALIIKSQILYKDDLTKNLLRAGSVKLLILTGAFVNDFQAPTDMLIVGKINKDRLLKIIRDLEKELGREINFTLLSAAEFKYRRDIADIFLYDLLEKDKIIVINEIGIS